MKISTILLICLFLLQLSFLSVQAQDHYLDAEEHAREGLWDSEIATIRMYREGWPMSYPIMRLRGDVPLILEFDDLAEDRSGFQYRIFHCNADWTLSDISEQEYLEGYPENNLPGGTPSFNTYTSYLHYELSIPNEDLKPLISGNYLLIVYQDYDPQKVVLTRRFMVTENSVSIDAKAGVPVLSRFQACCQEIDFTVRHQGLLFNDPYSECHATILQNGVWDMAVEDLPPYQVNPEELIYDYQEENVFPGGNEFRFFDTKNTRTPTYYVRHIDYIAPFFHFELKADQLKPAHVYLSSEDINGRYAIEAEGGQDPGLDADYVFVHFTLEMPNPLEGEVFLAGALTNWQFSEKNCMRWDASRRAYTLSLLLKQGVYNYRYLFLPQASSKFDVGEIEGSFFETENEYLILFYHRSPSDRYDKLLGHQIVHSNN